MTDRNAYMRDYMARRRAEKPASQKAQLQLAIQRKDEALRKVEKSLANTKQPAGLELLAIVREALA